MAGKTLEAEWNPLNVNDWSICDLRERRKTVKTEGKTNKCRLAMAGLCAGRPRPTILSTYSQKSFSASCGFICAQWPMWSIRPQAIGYRARSSFAENSALAQSQFCANGDKSQSEQAEMHFQGCLMCPVLSSNTCTLFASGMCAQVLHVSDSGSQ